MQTFLKASAAVAVAAMLAACGGGAANTVPSTGTGTTPTSNAQQTYPRTMVNSDGNKVVFFYNRQIESSGLVTNDPTGARVPMSVITGAMLYNGGPIQTAPKIYVDHWGNWGSTGDPDGVGNYYQSFISGVGGSSWMGTVTQYTQSGGAHVGNASGSYAGVWNDTTNAIPSLTRSGSYQSNLAAEAKRAAAHFGDYSVSASLCHHGPARHARLRLRHLLLRMAQRCRSNGRHDCVHEPSLYSGCRFQLRRRFG